MKASLAHLPEPKQAEIVRIAEIIREVVNPGMIILYGSYAKGKYVEHRYTATDGTKYEYVSDYDFLVVTEENPEKSYIQENLILNRTNKYDSPVNLEIHGIDYINKGLEIGEYFFVDIITEGVLLYDAGNVHFAKPRNLTAMEKKEKAHCYFDTWFPQGNEFAIGSKFYLERRNLKIGAFQLHQATESYYYTTLLVFTDYKPKTHNLWKLRKKAKPYSEALFSIFRAETDKNEEHLFELLTRGYIDARYRTSYEITEKELKILIERVNSMSVIVERICKGKMASFEK